MNLRFQIVDVDTHKLLAHTDCKLVCNLDDRNDVASSRILAWAQSCLRGIKQGKSDNIELRIGFSNDKAPEYLNLEIDGIKVF